MADFKCLTDEIHHCRNNVGFVSEGSEAKQSSMYRDTANTKGDAKLNKNGSNQDGLASIRQTFSSSF
jgi:hypothetical protein